MPWHNAISPIGPRSYWCGHCGHHTGPNTGFFTKGGEAQRFIYLCTFCDQPTYFDSAGRQTPGVRFGAPVQSLPVDVNQLYEEIRAAMTVNAYTSVALTARKILMHIGVEKGGNKNETFKYYVDSLASQGYVPPGGKPWVDRIRERGNEANHEIVITSEADAKELIRFLEMLLKFVYEFPAAAASAP